MKFILKGRVFLKGKLTGVYGAIVRISNPARSSMLSQVQNGDVDLNQRTNRDGAFAFHLKLTTKQPSSSSVRINVYDDSGTPLIDEFKLLLPGSGEMGVELGISDESFAKAKLASQPIRKPMLSDAEIGGIREAVIAVDRLVPNLGAQNLFTTYLCSLPPIFSSPDLVDIARGVLDGRAADFSDFRDRLDDLALFSFRNGFQLPPIDRKQAESFFSEERMNALFQQLKDMPKRRSIVPACRITAVVLAAAKIWRSQDPVAFYRTLAIIDHHLSALGNVHRLEKAAVIGLPSDEVALGEFFTRLNISAGGCSWSGRPWDSFPGSPGPHPGRSPGQGVITWPQPDDFIPREPEEGPSDEFWRIPERLEMWLCLADTFRSRILERTSPRPYFITSISPPHACPGDEMTITGTDLIFEGNGGEVHFSGPVRGTTIEGDVLEWTSTRIRVVVPSGASCGSIELKIPESQVFLPGCGVSVHLFYGAPDPFRFEGGETQITAFKLLEEEHCHYDSEGTVGFIWSTCNADALVLTLKDRTGTILAEYPDLVAHSGPFRATLPFFDRSTFVDAELLVRGPCGEDRELRPFFVRRALPEESSLTLTEERFQNWHGNIVHPTATFAAPTSIDEVVDVVYAAGQAGKRLGLIGSRWSYSNCVTGSGEDRMDAPDWLIKTDCSFENSDGSVDFANCEITTVIPFALRDDAAMILKGDLLREFTPGPSPNSPVLSEEPCTPPANRLIHVKAGIKLAHLNCLLDQKCLAMPTLGGSNGQSIAGAISTGTHGTNVRLPPIQDFVRAIHLIGPGGKQWWVEPASDPITHQSRMLELMASEVLDPCLELVYDDALFEACLVSLGAGGIFFSVVIEAAPKHHLRSETRRITFANARNIISSEILGPIPPFFAEFVLGPNNVVHYTTRAPAHPADDQDQVGEHHVWRIFLISWLANQVVTRVMPSLPVYLGQLAFLLTTPVGWFMGDAIRRQIRFLENLLGTLPAVIEILLDSGNPDEILVDTAVRALNLIWDIQTPLVNGRDIVEEFHTNVISLLRPPGTRTKNSYAVYNEQTSCRVMTHNAFERQTQSYEYVMDAVDVLPFLDQVRNLADQVKAEAPLILTINVRFTQGTRAMLGMQQFPVTGYVELWPIRGISGSDEFCRRLEDLTRDIHVIPHWGHYHQRFSSGRTKNFSTLYSRLEEWRSAMNRLARGTDGDPNTFRHGFVRQKNLLPDL